MYLCMDAAGLFTSLQISKLGGGGGGEYNILLLIGHRSRPVMLVGIFCEYLYRNCLRNTTVDKMQHDKYVLMDTNPHKIVLYAN